MWAIGTRQMVILTASNSLNPDPDVADTEPAVFRSKKRRGRRFFRRKNDGFRFFSVSVDATGAMGHIGWSGSGP